MKDFAKQLEAYFKAFAVERRLYYERRSNQYDSEGIERPRIIVHQNLVRAVGAMFLGEPHITTRNFRALRAKVGEDMFRNTDRMEPYYVAALAWYKIEQLFRSKRLAAGYKPARYQILLAVRLLMDEEPVGAMNSNKMAKRCEKMMEILWDEERTDALFAKAAGMVDELAGAGWNRDSIRTEPVTKAIFERFGHPYGRKQQEQAANGVG